MQTKVLVVNYLHKPGGYSHRLQMKIKAYLEQGWQVHYVAVKPYPYRHPNLVPHILFTPMRRFDTPWFWSYFFLLCPLFVLFVGWREKPNLISVFSPPYAWVCGLLKKVRPTPMALFLRTIPNDPRYTYRQSQRVQRIETWLYQKGLAWSDLVIANSETVLKETKLQHPDLVQNSVVIPNHAPAISIQRAEARKKLLEEFKIPAKSFVITSSGKLNAGKNLNTLISAVANMESHDVILILFGIGEEMENLKDLAKRLYVDKYIIFAGWKKDVLSYLPGTELFVLPSFKEGMSNSLLEAMACGVPCFVSDIPENRELISDEVQRFSPEDVDALSYLLNRSQGSPNFFAAIRSQTIADAKRFQFDWKKRVVDTVRPLLGKPKAH